MHRLALPIEQLRSHYPIVVVGSGYGGAIAASRFSRAGQKVCVLERGRERVPGEYPTSFLEAAEDVRFESTGFSAGSRTALFDVRIGADIDVVVGCGLGGTSLINANVSLRADRRVFQSWPKAIRDDLDELDACYARAEKMLGANPYPSNRPEPKKHAALRVCADALGRPFTSPPINVAFQDGFSLAGAEEKRCLDCGDCISGCNVGAKRTVLVNYLPDAVRHGAEIFCEVRVTHVSRDEEAQRWIVHFEPLDLGRSTYDAPTTFVTADMVVLAGGALGSTEILHRSRIKGLSISDRIGTHFTGNGDVLGFSFNGRERVDGVAGGDRRPGPTITGAIDDRASAGVAGGVVIEDSAIPAPLVRVAPPALYVEALRNGTNTAADERVKQTAREMESMLLGPSHGAIANTETFLVMCHDDGKGTIAFENDRVSVHWPGVGALPCFEKVDADLVTATRALGGIYVRDPVWADFMPRNLVTVHPLGGCPMADDAADGVVDHLGRVYAGKQGVSVHAGLFVLDGSILPSPLGVNPLLTISALAERACARIAKEKGWTIDESFKGPWTPPPDPRPVGLRFTERMQGAYASVEGDDYAAGRARGEEEGSTFAFVLTIASEDLDDMLRSPQHAARLVGTVEAPKLSSKPLEARGEFHLFVDDPTHVDTKKMTYALRLESEEGKRFFAYGFKTVRDRSIVHGWHDATTLYLTLHEGGDERGAVIGRGTLTISFADAVRLARTIDVVRAKSVVERMSSIARFGGFFFGTLWDHYGGVFARSTAFDPRTKPRKKREIRAPMPEHVALSASDGVALRLTRHRGEKAPVLLVHDLGTSSRIFTLDTIDTSLVEYLAAEKHDVFLLDDRGSIDLPKHPSDALTLARRDLPAAVAKVRDVTRADAVTIVAQGFGALAVHAAMIEGLTGVRSIVALQAGLDVVTSRGATLEAGLHVDEVLDALGVESLQVEARTDEPWWERLYDRALRTLPAPKDERCESDVCRRIRFVYGLPYAHAQLNENTHENVHEIIGAATMAALEDLASMVRRGHVANLGSSCWPFWKPKRAEHLARLALPITYLHGAKNRIVDPRATVKTMARLSKVNDAKLYRRIELEGYGHLDPIIGRDAARDVYPKIVEAIERTSIKGTAVEEDRRSRS